MKQAKAAGTARELKVMHAYRDAGWVAFRTPASMGVCDVIALRALADIEPCAEVHMVEVKANHGNPFMHFRRPERRLLKLAAIVAGAQAFLCHWPPHGERRDIPSHLWPDDSQEETDGSNTEAPAASIAPGA